MTYHTHLDRRIQRAYERMLAAKSEKWTHAWGDAFVAICRTRNRLRTADEVLELEKARGLR
jgi:hypothetical protein